MELLRFEHDEAVFVITMECPELGKLRDRNAKLLAALVEIVAITDRKTDVWDNAHALICEAKDGS